MFLVGSGSDFTVGLNVAFVAEAGVKATAIMVTVRLVTKWTGMRRAGVLIFFTLVFSIFSLVFLASVFPLVSLTLLDFVSLLTSLFLLAKKPSIEYRLGGSFCIYLFYHELLEAGGICWN